MLLVAMLGACSAEVERPGPTGPLGTKADLRAVRVLSPQSGAALSVDALLSSPGLLVLADASRVPEGGAIRFSVRTDRESRPFYQADVLREPGRLTANTWVTAQPSVLEQAASLRIVVTALDPGGQSLGSDMATVLLH